MDLHAGFLQAVKEVLGHAEVAADRFHVAKLYREGADHLRKQELKRRKRELVTQGGVCHAQRGDVGSPQEPGGLGGARTRGAQAPLPWHRQPVSPLSTHFFGP